MNPQGAVINHYFNIINCSNGYLLTAFSGCL